MDLGCKMVITHEKRREKKWVWTEEGVGWEAGQSLYLPSPYRCLGSSLCRQHYCIPVTSLGLGVHCQKMVQTSALHCLRHPST